MLRNDPEPASRERGEAAGPEAPVDELPEAGGGGALDSGLAEVPPRPRHARASAGLPHSVSDRLTVYVARAVFFLVAVGLGIHGARTFSGLVSDYDIDAPTGIFVASVFAVGLMVLEAVFVRSPIRTIAAVTVGLLMGLVLSLVFQPVVVVITKAVVAPGLRQEKLDALLAFLNLTATSIFCYFGVTLVVTTRDHFKFVIPYVEFRKEIKSHVPLVLDTSVFIDGRIHGLLAAGVFDQRLEVPRFVLDELQRIADHQDRSLRERGRRGLDILHEIERRHWLSVVDFQLEPGEEVDAALLRMCMIHEGRLVTTDHNLTKCARVQGVPVVNINDIAQAMRPAFVPGEKVRVRLQRAGDDAGQAVGFLKDGTMVVVDGAVDNVGQEVSVEVRSAIQTNAGKMVFGKLAKAGRGRSRSP